MEWYWYIYNNCRLFRNVRHFYLYVLKIDWQLQIIALLMFIVLTFTMGKKYNCHKVTRWQAFACVNLPVYIFVLFSSLVFSRTASAEINVNLQPFWTEIAILSGETKYVKTLLQNLFMLVPCGMLLPVATKISMKRTVFTGCLISVSIEVLQLITRTGLFELDDIIHNTLGALLGYCVFQIVKKIYNKWKHKSCVNEENNK